MPKQEQAAPAYYALSDTFPGGDLMRILSQRRQLALAAVVDIASAKSRPIRQTVLSTRHQLPARHFEPLLQTLARAGILRGVRGPGGGYVVARAPQDISCAEVVRAVLEISDEGDLSVLPSSLDAVILPAMDEAERAYFERLEQISVADLCDRASAIGTPLLMAGDGNSGIF